MQEKDTNVSGKDTRKNMNQKMFSSGVELGKFLGSIDLIRDAFKFKALSETSSTYYQLHTTLSGMKVLAFQAISETSLTYHNGEFDPALTENHKRFDFISTKVNPNFSINKAAVELFESHFDKLSELRNQLISSPSIITGQGMGGCLAILFALLHQHYVDEEESKPPPPNGKRPTAKRPICITFGSPLLGDEHLQGAISERPQWKSSFLNVVAKTDTLASIFSSNNTPYKPFGTFLFCTESGGHTAFENQDAILTVLDAMVSSNPGNSQMHDYSKEMGSIRNKVLYRGSSELIESNLSPLWAGIVTQFREIGSLNDISNDLIGKLEKKQSRMISKSRNVYEPTKKLNDMKIILTYMEWYMKTQRLSGGYYDSYKNAQSPTDIGRKNEAIRHQRQLNQYWKKTVEENDLLPQKEGAKLRKRWLFAGTNYRRIIEPLDIADHYQKGKKNYKADRPNHYKLLEKWSEKSERNTKAASLTEDSCFWAHVEEALILLRELKNGGPISMATDIGWFESYVLNAIKDLSLSPDVFLEGSSLMTWWSEYKAYKGTSYDSEFVRYMNEGSYMSYQ